MMQAVETKGVTPVGAFLIMLSAFPVAGMICAVYYHSSAIFYEALAAVPIAAVAGPVAILLVIALIQWLRSRMVGFVWHSTAGRLTYYSSEIGRTHHFIGNDEEQSIGQSASAAAT